MNKSTMYRYTTNRGKAVLCKGDDFPLKTLGQFRTEAEALAACKAHYEKAKKGAAALGQTVPPAFYA